MALALRKEVEVRHIESLTDIQACIYSNSPQIVKDGIRQNKHGDIQKFNCKDCRKYFTINIGFERMKHDPQGITTAMQLYFSGESLRNTARSLKLLGVHVSHQTIYNWINKYVNLMSNYVDKLKPKVSDSWRADEVWINVRGNLKYVFALMDDETRFWLAQEIADTKHKHDAGNLFKKGREVAGRRPQTLITDGLPFYHHAYLKEFRTMKKATRTRHVNTIKMQGDPNNNKMERLNGEFRDREKVMRGLKTTKTPIVTGYQLYHNFIRPHEALNGRTPAQACGIEVEGKNKWVTLIQNARRDEYN